MGKATILLIVFIFVVGLFGVNTKPTFPAGPQVPVADLTPNDQSAMHLNIVAVDPMLKPTDRYSVGEQVIVTIGLTNTSSLASYACISSDLYQDLPTLTKNGQSLPYTKFQSILLNNVRMDQTCRHDDLPEKILLKTNEPTVLDFITLVDDSQNPTGALAWYDPLTPGTYQLTIRRRLGCCDGPLIESNKINFEVVP